MTPDVPPAPSSVQAELLARKIRSTPYEWETWRKSVGALLPRHAWTTYDVWCWSTPDGLWTVEIGIHVGRVDPSSLIKVWRGPEEWGKARSRWVLSDPVVENIRAFLVLVGAISPAGADAVRCECLRNVDCPGPIHYGGCPRWQSEQACDHPACCPEPGCKGAP